MGYHYNLAQLISLQVIDGDSVLFNFTQVEALQGEKDSIGKQILELKQQESKLDSEITALTSTDGYLTETQLL